MANKKIGDTVTCIVDNEFKTIDVNFLIIDVLSKNNQIYLAYGEEIISKIQFKADNKWYLLDYININHFTIKHLSYLLSETDWTLIHKH